MAGVIEDVLVEHLQEAYAMEKTVSKLLDGMIRTTSNPAIVSDLETHKEETEEHAEKLKRVLESHGESPSKTKDALGALAAFAKTPVDVARGEQDMRNARDGFATEHLEIATYRLIQELAKAAEDQQALQVAAENIADEERMAARIQDNWEKVVKTSLDEESVETA